MKIENPGNGVISANVDNEATMSLSDLIATLNYIYAKSGDVPVIIRQDGATFNLRRVVGTVGGPLLLVTDDTVTKDSTEPKPKTPSKTPRNAVMDNGLPGPKNQNVSELVYVENVVDYRESMDVDDVIEALMNIRDRYRDSNGASPIVCVYSRGMGHIREAMSVSVNWLNPPDDEEEPNGRYAVVIEDQMVMPHDIHSGQSDSIPN